MSESLDPAVAVRILDILQYAHRQGRDMLFEHEVYGILEALEIPTPTHLVVRNERDITRSTLSAFSSRKVVLKVISPQVAHKRNAGGIRMVHKDLDFVRYSFRQLRDSFEAAGSAFEGALLVEFVEYSQDLGNEILLGFTEGDAFGPVISFSKGGADAEHFAENFSPPNLVLAPIDRRWAQALLESTKIQKKYASEDNPDHVAKIVSAGLKFSALACHFSNFCDPPTPWVLKEFEVNPFIFDPEGHFVALDGYARFAPREDSLPGTCPGAAGSLAPFFEPRGIAVVGISTSDPDKPGNIILKNLLKLERDDVYGVNVRGGSVTVAGKELELHPSVDAIDDPLELAIVAIPAAHTLKVTTDCAHKGVKAVVLIPGGFSEVQDHCDTEQQILALSRRYGMRVVGPNCLGIIHAGSRTNPGINTFFIPEEKFHPTLKAENNVAILSQSGALGITEIYNLRHAIAPKVVVSYGNQLDVDPADLAAHFETDPGVDVIGCYIEGFKPGAGRKFFEVMAASSKPVIVYKAGRTAAGRRAAQSHTASIAGEYAVARAAIKQAGQIVADTMIDHGDFIKTFALLDDVEVRGKRVAIIANAGYEKTVAADSLGGLSLAEFDGPTLRALEDLLPPFVAADPLLDLTPMADDALFERCVKIVLASPAVDALFISIVPQAQVIKTTDEEIGRHKENIAARLVKTVHRYQKPTVVSVNVVSGADAVYNRFGQIFDSGGIPTFLTAQRAMVCLNEFIRYRLTRASRDYSEWLK